jgi:hypothetical protein
MSTRDRLHELVDQLDEPAAQRLLAIAHELVPYPRPANPGLPAFVGAFASGHADISERAEDILRDELGGTPGS